MNKKLAIIGASYLQLPLIEKAKELGYTTHVFAWCTNDVGEKVADFFHSVSIIEKEKILKICQELHICGICSIASDVAVITVNYVANAMGLPGNSLQSTIMSTNKYMMRKAFKKNFDPSPNSLLVDINTDLSKISIDYPIIVKPTDRSGSRGIYKLENQEGLGNAVKVAVELSFEHKALVEEYVSGQEYSVEHISYEGKHYFLALTKKYTTGAPYFIEKGHFEPASVPLEILDNVKYVVAHALDTLEIKNGASHSEIKIDNNGNINIIEIGARMGGDCIGSDLVRYSTGYDFVKMVIDVACGKEPDFRKVCEPCAVKSVFILDNEDIKVFENLINNEPEKLLKVVNFHPENIGHVTDSSNRAGCYIRKV